MHEGALAPGNLIGALGMLLLAGGGCSVLGARHPAQQVQPRAVTAAEALDDSSATGCFDVSRGARPLVVDLKPEQRGDLEVAMSQGVAIVSWDCHQMRLLPDCQAPGSYGFKGVVLKQQLIRFSDANEIRANLPLSGAAIAVKLEAELERGTTLDLATALVGNLTSTRLRVQPSELAGACEGATHFVRGANIGAFVMQTGTEANVATAAQVFGTGAGLGSQTSKVTRVEDGRLEECRQATPDSAAPPDNCQALIRLRLLPISTANEPSSAPSPPAMTTPVATAPGPVEAIPGSIEAAHTVLAETTADSDDEATTCPEGLVFSEGKCVVKEKAKLAACDPSVPAECKEQCEAGEPTSCSHYARALKKGVGAPADLTLAATYYERACQQEHAPACASLGILRAEGQGGARDEAAAAELFDRACQLGDANGCFNLGTLYYDGTGVAKDHERAFHLFEQACNAGKAAGCINSGIAYDDGDGIAKNPSLAFDLFKRACEGDADVGCYNLAYMYSRGSGVQPDQAQAARAYQRACELGHAKACEQLAQRYRDGLGVDVDARQAAALDRRACELRQECREAPSSPPTPPPSSAAPASSAVPPSSAAPPSSAVPTSG